MKNKRRIYRKGNEKSLKSINHIKNNDGCNVRHETCCINI